MRNTGLPSRAARACHRWYFRSALPLFALLALILTARAQRPIPFDHLTVKQGLSQGTVLCILQDSQGFMWFGTQDGLNRYDGYEITVFKHDPAKPNSLGDNFIIFLAEDTHRSLWIGILNKPSVLSRFNRATETFEEVPRDSVDLRGARVGAAYSEYEDPSGVRWFPSTGSGGLARLDPRTGASRVYRHDPKNPASIVSDRVFSVAGDRTGALWVGTREGLDRFDPKTGIFVHYNHDDNNPRSLSDNYVWPVLVDRDDVVWVGTYRGGLNRLDRSTGSFTRYRHDESDPRSLAGNQIYSLYQDVSGMIWVGMSDHGVDRFHPRLSFFEHHFQDPSDPTSLADNNILSLHVGRSGNIWIGTKSGLDRWDRTKGKFTHYKHDPGNPKSITDGMVQVILEDRNGILWVGTANSGLDRLDERRGGFVHYRNDPADPQSISDNMIYALCEDRGGDLWIGTYGGGLNRLNPKTQTFTRYVYRDSVAGGLSAPGVWALYEDRDGVLWIGTYGGGLNRFNRESGTFTHFKHDASNPKSLSNDAVLCINEDRSGNLWLGTMGGLNRFDRTSGTFLGYREKDGLANDYVFGILEDDDGNLWMSTNKGISRFDPRTQTFRTFDYNDGLQGNEFNQGAYTRDPVRRDLYFGGPNGFNVFNPKDVRDNPYVPPVVLSSFTRYNTDDEQGRPIEEPGIQSKSEIALSYKDNVASFEFAALSFYNNFKNQYAYKLEGFNDNWIQLGTERKATFTNLDAGEYVLRVKGSNNDGVWNEEGASLRLIVNPPWWRTRWAYGLYAVAILGVLYTVRKFEIDRREQKAKARESQLRTKAVEAEKRALQAENERQTKELENARQLQLSMLPKEVPKLAEYDIAVSMKTATEVGGDYYDFSVAPDGTLNVAFGDATGHGMQAGTIVTLMKGLFLSEASRFDIQTFFNHCSKAIKDIRLGRLYMAFTLVRIRGNSVSLSSAGMPPVYHYRKRDGTVEEILLKGMPLGAMKNFPYTLYESLLERGDTLLLLTDGLPEQKNAGQEMFDYARVQSAFAAVGSGTPDEIVTHLVKEGDAWMNGAVQEDDITMLVIKMKE